jgi:uncharacterized Zn-binding protein involved in type VI secretion
MALSCCGSNTWEAAGGTPDVMINGLQAHRKGDDTLHCGAARHHLMDGSPNVFFGNERPLAEDVAARQFHRRQSPANR